MDFFSIGFLLLAQKKMNGEHGLIDLFSVHIFIHIYRLLLVKISNSAKSESTCILFCMTTTSF